MTIGNTNGAGIFRQTFAQAVLDGDVPKRRVQSFKTDNVDVAVWKEGADSYYALRRGGELFVRKSASRVHLKNFVVDPAGSDRITSGAVPPRLVAPRGNNLFILQFATQSLEGYKGTLARLGVEVHDYLGDNAYMVRATPEQRAQIAEQPAVRGLTPMHPAYKLSADLLADLSAPTLDAAPVLVDLVAVSKQDKPALVRLIEGMIAQTGQGAILNQEKGTDLLRVRLAPRELFALSRSDRVAWMEKGSAPEIDMNIARIQGGANDVQKTASGETRFDGAGLKVHIFEGIEQGHPEFAGNGRQPPIAVWDGKSSSHGTATAGEIAAAGIDPKAKGLVPKAQLFYTNYSGMNNNPPNSERSRMTLTEKLVGDHDIDSQTSSWGYARTLQYGARSREMDEILFRFPDLAVTQSQSNAGNGNSRPQAWAKNIIPGLAVHHYGTADPSDDKWNRGGSTRDGAEKRIGRSLSGYYDQIYTTNVGGRYRPDFGGTSGGTPMVNGHVNIAIHMYKDGAFKNSLAAPAAFRRGQRPHAATVAALMIASARQYEFSGLEHDMARTHQGWGFPDVKRLHDMRDRMFIVNEDHVLQNLERKSYSVKVAANEPELKVSMVYMDPPAAVNGAKTQVNDVDLKVTAPDGKVYWGNFGLLAGTESRAGGTPDTVDTVENVFIKNPQAGDWKVEVIAREVNMDAHLETSEEDVDFALVVLGAKKG